MMKYSVFVLALALGLSPMAVGAQTYLDTSVTGNAGVGVETDAMDVDANADTSTDAEVGQDTPESDEPMTGEGSMGSEGSFDISVMRSDVLDASADGAASIESALDVTDAATLRAYATSAIRADDNLNGVEMSADGMQMSYKQPARLLGFIPASMTVNVSVDSTGTVTVDYPWYSFFMGSTVAADDLEAELQAEVASVLGGAEAGTVAQADADASAEITGTAMMGESADASASTGLDARTRALIMERVSATLGADARGSADANS